ncbi:membrane protein [Glutamicibacter uratoxydans]|uniref:Membrane protein n=1 Tax=Glutamicibacter uratoxydans TaxID=43667 RepID=A0A4Y4DNZ4_GLUUR|nr:BMP family protein [Glutamicibacter uratoxydans]GED05375.1 membrane protein [Glutamicibacter uratoxydans]
MARRLAIAAIAALALTGCSAAPQAEQPPSSPASEPIRVAMLLAGSSDDGGFMESGYRGLQRAELDLGVKISHIEGVKPEQKQLEKALRDLGETGVDMIIAHGGQNSAAAEVVSAEYPQIQFVVTQSGVKGSNLSSYEVLQEESAWLAGAAAGLLTESDVVGHMSGIRPVPGLKGRAAFVDGVKHTNPGAKVLTNFSGDQDDVALAKKIALAEIEAGADNIFTMLNAGRPGVAEAMKETGKARQFGNVRDFTQDDPEIFVGSAVADSGAAAFSAIEDFVQGDYKPEQSIQIGLENPDAVKLTLAPDVPENVKNEVEKLSKQIIEDKIEVKTEYNGPEFEVS